MKVPCAMRPPPVCWERRARSASASAPAVPDDVLVGERERVRLHSELSGGEREDLAPEVDRGGAAGIAHCEGGAAALGAEIERRREGIGRYDADVGEIDAQLFRENLGGAGEGSGADLRRARVERHRAIGIDLHVHARGAASRRPPAAREALAAAGLGPAVLPADSRRRLHETLFQPDAARAPVPSAPRRPRGRCSSAGTRADRSRARPR